MSKFSKTKLNQTEFLTNKGVNSNLFTEGAIDFSPTKRNLLLILEFSHNQLVRSATLFNLGTVRTTLSQDVQTLFPVQLAFAKFLSKIKEKF